MAALRRARPLFGLRRLFRCAAPRLTLGLTLGLTVVSATALSVPAEAQPSGSSAPSERDKQRARNAVLKGDKLAKQGQLSDALAQYQLADGIMGVPYTRMKVATTLVDLGMLIRGREVARSIADIPLRTDEPAAFIKARNAAIALVKDIDGRIAVINVALKPDRTSLNPGTTVALDDAEMGLDGLGRPLELEPGEHMLVIRAPGYAPLEHRINASAGQRTTLRLQLSALGGGEDDGGGDGGGGGGLSPVSPVAWVGFAFAGAGLIAGGVTGGIAASRANDLKLLCSGGECPPELHADLDQATLLAHISTGSFAGAGAGAILGLIGLFALSPTGDGPDEEAAVRVMPYVTPSSIGLTGRF